MRFASIITDQMKKGLIRLNYSNEDIEQLKPLEANYILTNKIPHTHVFTMYHNSQLHYCLHDVVVHLLNNFYHHKIHYIIILSQQKKSKKVIY